MDIPLSTPLPMVALEGTFPMDGKSRSTISVSTSPIDASHGYGFRGSTHSHEHCQVLPSSGRKRKLSSQRYDQEDDTSMGTTDLLQLQIIAIQSQRQEKQKLVDIVRSLQQEVRALKEEMDSRTRKYQSFVKEVVLRRAIDARDKLEVFVTSIEQGTGWSDLEVTGLSAL
ncbi:hypothetical protein LTR70_004881 [Exophiala xenobiotica]|uniref:Uncharacterized protein n=1 Tax=Lithohypha guttulata TaxID=1690604 RepID=A0ABR0KC05_9EURO|nr:hypothetical protein LTR24_004499 [Lithohypha guttulata]KAK5319836.1 hypothetical protein LTR70_004881 [Exophiala xenobiotica]